MMSIHAMCLMPLWRHDHHNCGVMIHMVGVPPGWRVGLKGMKRSCDSCTMLYKSHVQFCTWVMWQKVSFLLDKHNWAWNYCLCAEKYHENLYNSQNRCIMITYTLKHKSWNQASKIRVSNPITYILCKYCDTISHIESIMTYKQEWPGHLVLIVCMLYYNRQTMFIETWFDCNINIDTVSNRTHCGHALLILWILPYPSSWAKVMIWWQLAQLWYILYNNIGISESRYNSAVVISIRCLTAKVQ